MNYKGRGDFIGVRHGYESRGEQGRMKTELVSLRMAEEKVNKCSRKRRVWGFRNVEGSGSNEKGRDNGNGRNHH